MKNMWVYILKCSDSSFYIGVTNNVDRRMKEHEAGFDIQCYTYSRRPVFLARTEMFIDPTQAIAREKQLKKWSHAKKQALIDEDWNKLKELALKK